MWRSLRAQLHALFLGFLLLVGSSVTATFWAIRTQAADATVINLAGRQRMLTQRMTWLALTQPESPELAASIQLFDQTLRALRDGGITFDARGRPVSLPPASDAALRAQVDEVAHRWAIFRAEAQSANPTALQAESSLILAQLDALVSGLEARAQAKLVRLRQLQLLFFALALLLLAGGYLLTRWRILRPLAALGAAAHRIAEGRWAEPVPSLGADELGELGRAFEAMRVKVAGARQELESQVAQRTHELTLAFELSQEIVAQLDLSRLLRAATDRARALTQAKAASLCLLDDSGTRLILAASSEESLKAGCLCQPVQWELAQQVISAGQTVVAETTRVACEFLRAHAPGQCVVAPLHVGETTLGALCVMRDRDRAFDPDEARALTLLANAAAIAVVNARLAKDRQRQAEQMAIMAERERLAAELHDHLAQTFSFLHLKADQLRELMAAGRVNDANSELDRIQSAIAEAHRQVRAALAGLRKPPTSPVEPLTAPGGSQAGEELARKLAACMDEFRELTGLPTDLLIADPSALVLPPVAQTQALYIVREALMNVRRHARASRVQVRVERVGDQACFTVEDDGCGFDPEAVEPDGHLGLAIMRARAERSGGALTVDSAPGAGTRITARWPLHHPVSYDGSMDWDQGIGRQDGPGVSAEAQR